MSTVSNIPAPEITAKARGGVPARRVNSYLRRGADAARRQSARRQIGIVIRRFEQPFYSALIDSTVKQLSLHGFDATVRSSHGTAHGETSAFDALVNNGCDGVILFSELLKDDELHALATAHKSTVILGRYLPGLKNRCVYSNNEIGGELAARCLVENGHRKIAMVTGPDDRVDTQMRSRGFVSELRRHGVELSEQLTVNGNFHESGGTAAMNQLMPKLGDFSAIFFQNDAMAIGALSVCYEHGINIPDDLSVIGYDDQVLAGFCRPRLTSIHMPLLEWGKNAARLMQQLTALNRPDSPYAPCIGPPECPPYLVQRDSIRNLHSQSTTDTHTPIYLSDRETHCLEWSARGKTSWEISIILGVSESTVVFHLRKAMAKLNAANRTQAVAIAISNSLISLD